LSFVDELDQRLYLDLLVTALVLSTLMKYMNFSRWLREISKRLELEFNKLEGTHSFVLLYSPKAEPQYSGAEPQCSGALADFLKSSTVRTPSS